MNKCTKMEKQPQVDGDLVGHHDPADVHGVGALTDHVGVGGDQGRDLKAV